MTSPTRRARWERSYSREQSCWESRLVVRSRGEPPAVLATVQEAGVLFYTWSLAEIRAGGWKQTEDAAQRAARKALREVGDATNSEAG